jgi:Dolichyl-phosphate-mannose-protein mannosyltransferase
MVNPALAQLLPRWNHLPIALILTLSFVLNMMGITWGLPNYVDWAADSIVPFDMLEAAYHRFGHGWAGIYPPLYYAVLAALSAPLMGYLILSGGLKAPSPIFPFGLTDPLSTLTQIILISRIPSLLMAVGIVFLVYLTVHELFDRRAALFSALIVTFYHPLIYYAHNVNTDVPYLFLAMLAIYNYLQLLKKGSLKYYLLFALFGTLAVCTKDQAYGLFLLSPLPILCIRFTDLARVKQQRQFWSGVLCDRKLLLSVLVAVATFVVAHNLLFNLPGFLKHIGLITGSSKPYAAFQPTLFGRLHLLQETASQLALGLTPPLFGLCLLGSIYCALKFPRYSLSLLFVAATYYLTFIDVVRYVPLRFVLPIGIIIAFFGGKLLAELWLHGPWEKLRRVAICLVFAYAAFFAIELDLLLIRDPRYSAEQWLQENLGEGAIIETFAPRDTSFKHYPRFPSWVKVRSSKLAAGTEWEIRDSRPDRRIIPNLYMGREPPDCIVLSNYWYRELLIPEAENTAEARVLQDFFQGRTDYTLRATFETPTLVPIHGLPINPRIDIFVRTDRSTRH